MTVRIHPTAEVSSDVEIGDGSFVWGNAQVREGARLGKNCILGKGVYVDAHVKIGNNVKIQNYSSVYEGVTLEDGVFVGPHVCFTNDLIPRAVNPDGSLKSADDWIITPTLVKEGAALGANTTVRCGVQVGAWAMTGSGSVITRDIPDHGLVWGNPARLRGFVCRCGFRLEYAAESNGSVQTRCTKCGQEQMIPLKDWSQVQPEKQLQR